MYLVLLIFLQKVLGSNSIDKAGDGVEEETARASWPRRSGEV